MTVFPTPWSRIVRRLRTRLGLTQQQAAARLGVTRNTWAMWERGEHIPQKVIQPIIMQLAQKARREHRRRREAEEARG